MQITQIADAAKQCGFKGGVLLDYPNSAKGKKYFMCVQAPGKRVVCMLGYACIVLVGVVC